MFAYSDPTGDLFKGNKAALSEYRILVHQLYVQFSRVPDSAFTLLEAFDELSGRTKPVVTLVSWLAFPKSVSASHQEIDGNRFRFQDEYVEWRVEKRNDGKITRVTFTTEFFEHYEALARVGLQALVKGIRRLIPGANPTIRDVFGPNFNPSTATPEARAGRLRTNAQDNPWNNGEKGILFLTQPANTMGALFNLVGACALPRLDLQPADVCANVAGACVPDRNSDPVVCQSAQNLARSENGLSLKDPVGVRMIKLEGIWKINGQQVDINNLNQNLGAWVISHNGRRAVLDVSKGVTIGDDVITTGTQVSTRLLLGAEAISAPEDVLPTWARTGQESSRRIV